MAKKIMLVVCGFFGIWVVNCGCERKYEPDKDSPEQEFVVSKAGKRMGEADYEDQRRYEQLQHEDYLNNRERYTEWPEMGHLQMTELCKSYLQKIFRRTEKFELIPEIVPEPLQLIYRIIKDESNKPVAPIRVSAIQCYYINSPVRKNYFFIRGLKSHCLFLIKPADLVWRKHGCFIGMAIINEFCDKANNDRKDSENSIGDHRRNSMPSKLSMSKSAIRKRSRRKSDEASSQLRALYERAHFDYYNLKPDRYIKWPETEYQQLKEMCNIYMSKIFRKSQKLELVPEIMSQKLSLTYRIIKDGNNRPIAPIRVCALQCYHSKSYVRKYFHFIKGPRPHCLFLIKPIKINWNSFGCSKNMAIVNELCGNLDPDCHESAHSRGTDRGQRRMTRKAFEMRMKRKKDEADTGLLVQYEQAHVKFCKIKPDECQTWPELDHANKVSFCKTFVQKVIKPVVIQEQVLPDVRGFEKLIYTKILTENGHISKPPMLTILRCRVPEAQHILRSLFQFVKAPTPNCVFLVKPTAWNLPQEFVIVNMFCDE